MIKAGLAAACAVLISFSGPAEACFWKRDGHSWRSAGYGYNDGWGHRRHWRGDGYGYRSGGWGDRRHERRDGYGWRGDRAERRGLFRDRRMQADVVTK